MFRSHFRMALLASTCMASQAPPEEEGQIAETQPGPSIGSAQQAVGEDLPEGFKSWEEYRAKGGVLEETPPAEDTTKAAEGDDKLKGTEAGDKVVEETPEQKTARVAEVVKLSTDGMEPEMATKVTPFVQAFAETGTLTDQQITDAATATGMSAAMVRQYMAGAVALQEKSATQATAEQAAFVAPFHKEFGGEETYAEFQKWTGEDGSLTPEEVEAFNDALDNSPKAALQMAKQFKARWQASGAGDDVVDLTRGTGAEADSDKMGYVSQAEQNTAMADPRYRTDPAYRDAVIAKIAKSSY
jgi:hypothetical protein